MTKPRKKSITKVLGTVELYLDTPDKESFNALQLLVNRMSSLSDRLIQDIKDRVSEIQQEHGDKFIRFSYVLETMGEGYGWGAYDEVIKVTVRGHRPETDKEFAYRLKREKAKADKEAKIKKAQNNKDLKEYERLKKKFG